MNRPYILPNHPSERVCDRFSLLDDLEGDDGLVPLWPLLKHIIQQPATSASQVIDILDTISNTIREHPSEAGDYGTLRSVIEAQGKNFFEHIWPRIVQYAEQLPEYFPGGQIIPLQTHMEQEQSRKNRIVLHWSNIACLLAHQFLCTLRCPSLRDGYFDFSIWYNSEQRHPKAVWMYFTAFIAYFESLGDLAAEQSTHKVEYSLYSFRTGNGFNNTNDTTPLCDFVVSQVDAYTTDQQLLSHQGANSAVVVSANKYIGFGQSATQEELFVGNAPEACPAVLFTPPLEDDQVLVVCGARPILQITGQRREIEYSTLGSVVEGVVKRQEGGRMLFMDALEIDEMECEEGNLPDLKEEYLEREIRKAYTAFSAWAPGSQTKDISEGVDNVDQSGGREDGGSPRGTIWTGVWGCGAFNGDPGVKMVAIWIAASLAGRNVHLTCDLSHGEFPERFGMFVKRMKGVGSRGTVGSLKALLSFMPRNTRRLETVDWLLANMESG